MPLKSRLRSGRGSSPVLEDVQENQHNLEGNPMIATAFSCRQVVLEALVWDYAFGRVYTHGSQCRQFGHSQKGSLMRTRTGLHYIDLDSVKHNTR